MLITYFSFHCLALRVWLIEIFKLFGIMEVNIYSLCVFLFKLKLGLSFNLMIPAYMAPRTDTS